jgi:signal transduction histidine kinase
MENAETVSFDLEAVLTSTAGAYRDAYPDHRIEFSGTGSALPCRGSPELLIQMLDKLVDNATGFAPPGTTVWLGLTADRDFVTLSVENAGPPLPEQLKGRLFDSLVSVRSGDDRHLGLGLYIARLIAEGHGGTITADNTDDGVRFDIRLPRVGTQTQGR